MTEQMALLDAVARVWVGLMWLVIGYTVYSVARQACRK